MLLCVCKGACVFVSAQGAKQQNKPEVAWQHKTLPNVNFEDAGTAGGGERKKKTKMESTKKDVFVTEICYLGFWGKLVSDIFKITKQNNPYVQVPNQMYCRF